MGRDLRGQRIGSESSGFNPRAHVGRDADELHNLRILCVSIHAPTWGATRGFLHLEFWITVSIHAPTWGATDGDSDTNDNF